MKLEAISVRWSLAAFLCVALMFGTSGCGILWDRSPHEDIVDRGEPPTPPPGTVRYCWEEPIVRQVRQNPGIDPDGKWYHPSYIAVREVRQGKWRPCEPVNTEVTGAIEEHGYQERR